MTDLVDQVLAEAMLAEGAERRQVAWATGLELDDVAALDRLPEGAKAHARARYPGQHWKVYDFIIRWKIAHTGNSPTVRDIQKALDISSTSVVEFYLTKLEQSGCIRLAGGKGRSIEVVGGRYLPPPGWTGDADGPV